MKTPSLYSPRTRRVPPEHVRSDRVSAFTLIELLTVIAIIGILAAILIPVVGKVRDSAKGAKCMSQVYAITMAYKTYPLDNDGRYPETGNFDGAWGQFWTHRLLDYIDFPNKNLYNTNRDQYSPRDGYLWCPAEENHHGIADYGPSDFVIPHSHPPPLEDDILDPSRTVLVGEGILTPTGGGTWWLKSGDFIRGGGAHVASGPVPTRHGDHGFFGFCDGHVEKISTQRLIDERASLFTGPYDPRNPAYNP